MGQYTWYVYSCVGIVVLSLAWLGLVTLWQHRQTYKNLKRAIPTCH
ncbi:MAG: heme exporter protein CcmD [Candidatus Berkiella sp.]